MPFGLNDGLTLTFVHITEESCAILRLYLSASLRCIEDLFTSDTIVFRGYWMRRISIFLITVALLITAALIAGTVPRSQTPASPSHILAIASTSGGNVTTPGVGNFTYYEGTAVNLVATPHVGYHFVGWTGNVSTISNVNRAATSITVNGEYSIMANFEVDPPVQYMLAILSSPGGSVISPGEGTFTYDAGTVVNLVATPASGYKFFKWSGDVDTIANVTATSTNITMSGNYSYILICANFRESPPVCTGLRY